MVLVEVHPSRGLLQPSPHHRGDGGAAERRSARSHPLSDVGMVLNSAVHVVMYAYYLDPSRFGRDGASTAQTVQHATMAGVPSTSCGSSVHFLDAATCRGADAGRRALRALPVQFTLFLVETTRDGVALFNARGWKLV